jgi:hypothetical protein
LLIQIVNKKIKKNWECRRSHGKEVVPKAPGDYKFLYGRGIRI